MAELTQYRWVQGWHMNASNHLFGGKILSWADEDTMMLASLASKPKSMFVTAGMEKVRFVNPVLQGERLKFHHKIVFFGHTCLWFYTEVSSQELKQVFTCYTCVVAIESDGRPVPIHTVIDEKLIKSITKDVHWFAVDNFRKCRI